MKQQISTWEKSQQSPQHCVAIINLQTTCAEYYQGGFWAMTFVIIRLAKTLRYIYDSIPFPHIKWITIMSCILQDANKPQQGNDAVLTSQMPLQYVLRHISSVGDWRFFESRSFLLTTTSRPLDTCDDYTAKSTIMHSPISFSVFYILIFYRVLFLVHIEIR